MKKFEFNKEKMSGGSYHLPVGAYVMEIKKVEMLSYKTKDRTIEKLKLSIDVAEGELKGFFFNNWKADTSADKKFKGNFVIDIPDESYAYYESQKKKFGNLIACLEESNDKFVFDWDEKKLVGLKVGVLYRNFEWEMNGKTGWSTEAGAIISVDDVKNGNFKPLKDRPLKNKSTQAEFKAVEPSANDEEIPW